MSAALGQMEYVKEAEAPGNKHSGRKSSQPKQNMKAILPKIIGDNKFPNDS